MPNLWILLTTTVLLQLLNCSEGCNVDESRDGRFSAPLTWVGMPPPAPA